MKKEGLYEHGYFHNLAHRLTDDPSEEIQGALEAVVNKKWEELADKENSALETEIKEAKIDVTNNGVNYEVKHSLPANYDVKSYNIATGKEDEAPDMSYAFDADIGWKKAKVAYEQQMKEDIQASVLKCVPRVTYKDGNSRIAAKNYAFVNTFLNFILHDIARLQGI